MKKIVIHKKFEVRKSEWEMGEKISNWKNFNWKITLKNYQLIVIQKIGVKFKLGNEEKKL